MGVATPQLALLGLGQGAPQMLDTIGERYKDDPSRAVAEKSKFVDAVQEAERLAQPSQPGLYSNKLRSGLSKPGESLITGKSETKGKRKRIYGMGGSQGTEQSGAVKKPTLGGE